jgi:hypothetical protein
LIRSGLEYASQVWSPWAKLDINRIESIQKKFTFFALRYLPWQTNFYRIKYWSRLSLIGLESLECRREIASCLLVFDVLRKRITSPSLSNMVVVKTRNTNAATTRSAGEFKLSLRFTNNKYEENCAINRACKLFNDNSQLYDTTCSREVFKNRLKVFLVNKALQGIRQS